MGQLCDKQTGEDSQCCNVTGPDVPWQRDKKERQRKNANDGELDAHVAELQRAIPPSGRGLYGGTTIEVSDRTKVCDCSTEQREDFPGRGTGLRP